MMNSDFGYFLGVLAVNMLFVFIALQALAVKKNRPGIKKWLEKISMIMIIPLAAASIANFLALRPAWTVITPLLMVFFLAADAVLDRLVILHKDYFVLAIFNGLFFITSGMGMAFYAFAAGTATGFITLVTMTAAGWAGFLSSHSHFQHHHHRYH